MKYTFLATLVLMAQAGLAADTTLEFPLTATTYNKKGNEVKLKIKTLNNKLKKKKLDGLPETIVLKADSKAYHKVLMKRLEAAAPLYPKRIDTPIKRGYLNEYPEICYRGNINDVGDILSGMKDTFFNEGQGILATRWGKKKHIESDDFKKSEDELKEQYEDASDELAYWLDYDETSDVFLVLSNWGDQGDGTEIVVTEIAPCE